MNEKIDKANDIYNEYTWNEDSNLKIGIIFPDKDSLNEALKIYLVKQHQDYRVSWSTKSIWMSYDPMLTKDVNSICERA